MQKRKWWTLVNSLMRLNKENIFCCRYDGIMEVNMSYVQMLFQNGCTKVLTLSYDDGVEQDRRLVDIFNKYGLKATFNLNSGIQSRNCFWNDNGIIIRRMDAAGIEDLYNGHEVAVHGLTHPFLDKIPREMIITEVFDDRKGLEKLFEYPVRGMAYPFGTYNNTVLEVLKTCGIEYSRTVKSHGKFELPENFLEWHPTCHHSDSRLMELAKEFVDTQFESMSLFYVWGHSYEFDVRGNWSIIENFCKFVSRRNDIWYATNIEIYDYLKAAGSLKFSADCSIVYNPSATKLWLRAGDKATLVKPGETVKM